MPRFHFTAAAVMAVVFPAPACTSPAALPDSHLAIEAGADSGGTELPLTDAPPQETTSDAADVALGDSATEADAGPDAAGVELPQECTADGCEAAADACQGGKNPCACLDDADCAAQDDGNACNGTCTATRRPSHSSAG